MGVTLQEGNRTGEFLLSDAGMRSRDKCIVTIAGAIALASGTLLGKITNAATAPVAAAVAGNTGNGTMGTVTAGDDAIAGVYTLTIVEPASDAGSFIVEDPEGRNVGNGEVAVAFSGGGLGFTLADGSNNFAAGDQFTITVAAGTGKYVAYAAGADSGANKAAAVLLSPIPGVNGDHQAVIYARDCEVIDELLIGKAGNYVADLARTGIICRFQT